MNVLKTIVAVFMGCGLSMIIAAALYWVACITVGRGTIEGQLMITVEYGWLFLLLWVAAAIPFTCLVLRLFERSS